MFCINAHTFVRFHASIVSEISPRARYLQSENRNQNATAYFSAQPVN